MRGPRRGHLAAPGPGASPAPDLLLVAAAVASAGLARAAEAVIRVSGGFVLKPVATQFAGLPALPQHVKLTAEGLLVLFGPACRSRTPARAWPSRRCTWPWRPRPPWRSWSR